MDSFQGWEPVESMEGVIQVQMTLSIDGREVETWRTEISGDARQVEERSHGFVRDVGNRVIEEAHGRAS